MPLWPLFVVSCRPLVARYYLLCSRAGGEVVLLSMILRLLTQTHEKAGHLTLPAARLNTIPGPQPKKCLAKNAYSGMPNRIFNGKVIPRERPKYSDGFASGIA